MNIIKTVWSKVVLDESGDLVQNVMWLAFIALACLGAIKTLGTTLGGKAGSATDELLKINTGS